MPKKKLTKEQLDYKEGVADFKAWLKMNKDFEDQGLHGTDYYVRMVEELEAKIKRLEAKLKRKVQ
jgi:arylsulfatase A-like enzyme